MKNILYFIKGIEKYLICFIGTSLIISCNDFLTTIPESSYSVDTFYKTQSDFEKAIAAVYAAQQDLYNGRSSFLRTTIGRSDDTSVMGTNTYLYGVDTFTDGDAVPPLEYAWQYLWIMISRSNVILDKIDGVTFEDNGIKNYIKGEAYALRAWAYYTLATSFGGMPIIDKEMSVSEIKTIPRSSQEETLSFVEKDYKQAITLLPTTWTDENLGRVTKYAAEGGLARLYMFKSEFSTAKTYLKDIIDSGLYEMEANYVDCFRDSHDNGKERLWEVQYIGNLSGEGQSFSNGCLTEGYSGNLSPFNGASEAMHVSNNLINAYEPGDIRKEVTIATNLNINGIIDKNYWFIKFLHYDYKPQSTDDWAVNLPIMRYTDVLLLYAECLNEELYDSNGDAFLIINKVRKRANLPSLNKENTPSQADFRKALKKERRIEFAYEGLRWPDLVRWGDAKVTMNAFFQDSDEGAGIYSMDGDYRNIYAIPGEEMTRYNNTKIMWQNPGY